MLYYTFSKLIPLFRRDAAVLVYDLDSLKKISNWQTLGLIKDAFFVLDRAEIEKLFDMILRKAVEREIIYFQEEKVFKLKKPERKVFPLIE